MSFKHFQRTRLIGTRAMEKLSLAKKAINAALFPIWLACVAGTIAVTAGAIGTLTIATRAVAGGRA